MPDRVARVRAILRASLATVAILGIAACGSAPSPPPPSLATGPILTAAANGPLACPLSPMGCVLSLEVVPGSGPWDPPAGYEPPPERLFRPAEAANVLRPPDSTPMSVAAGHLRVAAVLTIVSDLVTASGPSYMGVGWFCQAEVEVKPATHQVSVAVALFGALPCTISAKVE